MRLMGERTIRELRSFPVGCPGSRTSSLVSSNPFVDNKVVRRSLKTISRLSGVASEGIGQTEFQAYWAKADVSQILKSPSA
jgi:hypothetical protein